MNLIFDFLWVLITLAAIILVVAGVLVVTLTIRNRGDVKDPRVDKPHPPATHTVPKTGTPKERLQELAALRVAGTITTEEYGARRDAILREL